MWPRRLAVHGVVACGESLPFGHDPLAGEAIRVSFTAVDEYGQALQAGGFPARHADRGTRGTRRTWRLPEDCLPPVSEPGEDQLRSVLAGAIEHEVDGDASPYTGPDGYGFHHIGLVGPFVEWVAVHP